jgi:hypothetical protein
LFLKPDAKATANVLGFSENAFFKFINETFQFHFAKTFDWKSEITVDWRAS